MEGNEFIQVMQQIVGCIEKVATIHLGFGRTSGYEFRCRPNIKQSIAVLKYLLEENGYKRRMVTFVGNGVVIRIKRRVAREGFHVHINER